MKSIELIIVWKCIFLLASLVAFHYMFIEFILLSFFMMSFFGEKVAI